MLAKFQPEAFGAYLREDDDGAARCFGSLRQSFPSFASFRERTTREEGGEKCYSAPAGNLCR